MTVYVDELRYRGMKYRGRYVESCHMMTDSNIAELHDMAEKIGMRRWFQDHPMHPHYDLMASKRRQAVRLGAVEVNGVELVKKCSKVFNKQSN